MGIKQRGRTPLGGALVLLLVALGSLSAACGDRVGPSGERAYSGGQNRASAPASNSAPKGEAAGDAASLSAEIESLEKQAERNPADDDAREALSRAYVRRANFYRDARQLREAMSDYLEARRINPDNEEAIENIAQLSPLVEGTPTAENGEPAPLPISPNATTDGGEQPPPTKTPKSK